MLTKFICTILLFILSIPVYSQTNSESGYLTLSYSYGITKKSSEGSLRYGDESGTINQVELSNIPEGYLGYFVNFTSTTYESHNLRSQDIPNTYLLRNYGLSGGIRFYTNENFFIDLGTGFHNLEGYRPISYLQNGQTKLKRFNRNVLGINLGLGVRVKIDKACALVLKGKFNNIISSDPGNDDYSFQEFNLNAGIEMGNIRQTFLTQRSGNFSTGIILGNTGRSNNKFVGSYGTEFSFGLANNFSLIANYIHKSSDKTYSGLENLFEAWENNYGGGIRNYFGRNNLKPFFECLANLNVRKENTNDISENNTLIINSIGLVLGTGAEFELSDRVTGILKGNITFFDNIDNAAGMYGGLKYRF